jgi:epoxyqueuosine reductase
MAAPETTIAAEAAAAGFALAGCARLETLPREAFLAAWLAEGRAGDMRWLAERTAERLDPRRAHPWARSVIALAATHPPAPPPPGDWRVQLRGRIAAYAVGPDYHGRLHARLGHLRTRLEAAFPGARFRACVDTAPLLEREWAQRAGLGWIGRNTLLLDRRLGSYVLLAELLTDLDLAAPAPRAEGCGGCARCVEACPTGALEPPGWVMDPRRCLAYLTIEHRGPIPHALRPALGNWIFGCDLCQEACPWNDDAADAGDAAWLAPPLRPLLALDAAGFRARFGATAVARARRRGLLRNVAVALGNSGNPDAVPALAAALGDVEPLVRGHAAWALGRLDTPAAREHLEIARLREPDAGVRTEIVAALDGHGAGWGASARVPSADGRGAAAAPASPARARGRA